MAFTGELEHLPIVDLIQLLNSTRKTGVLTVKGRKGESQLVFKDGFIVSASHLNNSVRIGDMLLSRGLISQAQLDQALQRQQLDGADRKPLAITLIEMGAIEEEGAYKGLQSLIEMTIVEILTWKSGRFTLEHLNDAVSDNFKYYPERMNHEINVNTQSILMEVLRIFDERKRDGLIEEEQETTEFPFSVDEMISADDLGLSAIDQLSIPLSHEFTGVAPVSQLTLQQAKVQNLAPGLSPPQSTTIAEFLAKHASPAGAVRGGGKVQAKLLIASTDDLLIHALRTVAESEGVCCSVVQSDEECRQIIESCRQDGCRVRVVFDAPQCLKPALKDGIIDARAKLCSWYPALPSIQLATESSLEFALDAYRGGVRAVVPRPSLAADAESFADEFIQLVAFLPSYLQWS